MSKASTEKVNGEIKVSWRFGAVLVTSVLSGAVRIAFAESYTDGKTGQEASAVTVFP